MMFSKQSPVGAQVRLRDDVGGLSLIPPAPLSVLFMRIASLFPGVNVHFPL